MAFWITAPTTHKKTQLDAKGNRILWAWIPEKRSDSELIAAGWAGCMALPRVLSLSPEGELEMVVAAEAQSLRVNAFSLPGQDSAASAQIRKFESIAFENLCAEFAWKTSAPTFALALEDRSGSWWSISRAGDNSKAKLAVNGATIEVPAASADGSEFHLFLDASVAEFFVDRRHANTSRIYRKPDGPLHLKIGHETKFTFLNAWQLQPISRDRLTT